MIHLGRSGSGSDMDMGGWTLRFGEEYKSKFVSVVTNTTLVDSSRWT